MMDRAEQIKKAEAFQAMHQGPGILVLPNAWDVISAHLIVRAGFGAVATTSGGCAHSLGYPDGEYISGDEMGAAIGRIAQAVAVPVTADMEACYATAPEDVARLVRAVIDAGAVGINIEDANREVGLFDRTLAIERIQAAVEAVKASGVPALINARTDCFHVPEPASAFDEGAARLNAYLEAGAGCAFAIFVRDGDTIARLAKAVDGPLNILPGPDSPSVAELESMGVRRVTVGGAIARAALTAAERAIEELRDTGTYEFARGILAQPAMNKLVAG
ncbi:MAG: isocitrate lyase/phosphoenolpyruvate mutase family protein [Alphaproteobacteria bacterium]